MSPPSQPWHLRLPNGGTCYEFDSLLRKVHIMYYKPHKWTSALRVEMASSVATNRARIAVLLQGIKHQCRAAGIFEPYPLYMADRMVKHLGRAVSVFRQAATKKMTALHTGDLSEIFFSMHGYRTESGR